MKTKFAVIADIHFGPAKYDTPHHKAVAEYLPDIVAGVVEKINRISDIEFVINLGDLVQEYSPAPSRAQDLKSAERVLGILGELKKPLYHLMGNHDCVTLSRDDLKGIFGHDLYYSFETAEYTHIALQCDSPGHVNVHLPEGETEWLMAELKKATKPVVVYMHQMLVEHPLAGTSCEGMPECAYVRNREEIKDILVRSGKVRAVLNGHMHSNLFKVEAGIPYATIQALTEPFAGEARTAEAYAVIEITDNDFSASIFGNDPANFSHRYI